MRRVLPVLILVIPGALACASNRPVSTHPNTKRGVPLVAPPGKIPVAFVVTAGANIIDFAGPWEVFSSTHLTERGATYKEQNPFELYVVSDSLLPVMAGAPGNNIQITPAYAFSNAPRPRVVVIGAQRGNPAVTEWIKEVSPSTDITASVCGGAFRLAEAGLLDGEEATTHHDRFDDFEKQYPKIRLRRGVRFVENEKVSTAGGLTSGIDLALRIVERYFGRSVAEATAKDLEYEGEGWKR